MSVLTCMEALNGARTAAEPLYPTGITTLAHTPRGVAPFRRKTIQRIACGMSKLPLKSISMPQKSKYTDSWIDTACINYLAGSIEKETGIHSELQGYDRLIDASRKMMNNRTPVQQRETVLKVLRSLMPSWLPQLFRILLPPSKVTWEFYAVSTPLMFKWLVGSCEVREAEIDGLKQRSVVHIKKCRYLESTNCVGMCVNLCKLPAEKFLNQTFGATVTMTPNFEDMSCDMIFGQMPVPLEEDPALKQPCYTTLCKTAQRKMKHCPKLA